MNDLLLLAASPSDGWALVREEDRHWLVRPPYRQQDRDPISVRQANRALAEEDFEPVGKSFSGWGSLTRHLDDLRVAHASPEEREQAREAARRLLTHATVDQARRHLSQISAALDAGRRTGVSDALGALLEAESVRSHPELLAEVARLLGRYRSGPSLVRADPPPQARWPVPDEDATAVQARRIAKQGTVLCFDRARAA